MTRRQRFDLAITYYKDVCEQLRRWEAMLIDQGDEPEVARAKVYGHLHTLNLFPLHRALFALDADGTDEAAAEFDKELAEFEAALNAIRATLVDDGFWGSA